MNKEIEECLKGIFNSLSAQSEKETKEIFGEAIKKAKESKIDLSDIDNFNCFINHKVDKAIKALANSLHEPSVLKDKNKPNFIYRHSDFLEHNIRQLCVIREGNSCCADKSRHILLMYLKYSITGEIPEFDEAIENYWTPNFGDYQMWINFCDSLCRLYYGYTEEYINAYNALLKAEIRKYKHSVHRWYMEFEDGDLIEYHRSWDDDLDNPLDGDLDKGDFYVMSKLKTGEKEFEDYIPSKDERLLWGLYVMVPKASVKRIYKSSEEIMI